MGCLRLLLALSVVAGHSQTFFRPFFLINAKAAVLCFFVISGFYMALVLNEKYTDRGEFLLNRWLRIYVPYIVVTLLYGIYLYVSGRLQLNWTTAVVNVALIGQDIARGLNNVLPTPHDPLGIDVVVVPQSWTLSVELQLYALAALLFWRRGGILSALAIGVALRVLLHVTGYAVPPYTIGVVPGVMVYFALGGVSYLCYRRTRNLSASVNAAASGIVLAVLAWYCIYNDSFAYPMDAESNDWRFLPLYGLTAVLLPFLFALTRDIKADRMLGELSYPTYLVHVAVIDVANRTSFGGDAYTAHYSKCFFILGVTLGLAWAMYRYIDQRLTDWRQRLPLRRLIERKVAASHLPGTATAAMVD